MAQELWRSGLTSLKARFEAAGQKYENVYISMIHAGSGHADKVENGPWPESEYPRFLGGGELYDNPDVPVSHWARRRFWYGGHPDGAVTFSRLIAHASKCLASAPRTLLSVSPLASRPTKDSMQWIWLMFDLAWSGRIACHAERLIWFPDHSGTTTFPYDQAGLRRLSEFFQGADWFKASANELPDYFCSRLDDAFLAATSTIDYFLADHSTGESDNDERNAPAVSATPTIEALRKFHNALRGAVMVLGEILPSSVTVQKADAKRISANRWNIVRDVFANIRRTRSELAAVKYNLPDSWLKLPIYPRHHTVTEADGTTSIALLDADGIVDTLKRVADEVMGAIDIATANPPTTAAAPPVRSYDWARQSELVRATNQVLGEAELNPGVLSRACQARKIITNGKTGRGSLVEVKSFLAWLKKKRELADEELVQVRNAIIGEINERK